MKTVFCPLKNNQINGTDCMLTCDVAGQMVKPTVLPPEIGEWTEEKRQICLKCKYHADLNESEKL